MAKSYEEIKDVIATITNEVEDGANTAKRIGSAMNDIADFAKEVTDLQGVSIDNLEANTEQKLNDLVVQETGDGENVVMSQKAVSGKLSELGLEVGLKKSFIDTISGNNGAQLLFSNLNIKKGETFSIKLIGTIGKRTILRYNSISTNTIADYMTSDTWYRFTAPADISSLYLWYDSSVDLTCELRKGLSEEVREHANMFSDIVGLSKSFTDIIDGSNGTQLLFSNLGIKAGETFSLRLVGTIGKRTILRYNSVSNNTLVDYMIADTWYRITAPSDISSLYLWYDSSMDLTCELKVGIGSEIQEMSESTKLLKGYESKIYKVIESGNNRTAIFNKEIDKEVEFYIRITGKSSASRLILRYNDGNTSSTNLKDYVQVGQWYRFVAPNKITSIWLWYNGTVDLTFELKVSIGAEIPIFDIFTKEPLSNMPPYIAQNMSYKPLGSLSKGYFCLSDDDGHIGLSTYTIPMMTEKNFPFTMSLFKDSEVMDNESTRQQVVNAVNEIGCSVAQHGGKNWTEYTEIKLYEFINSEREFFKGLGININSAVIPSHMTSSLIESIVGGIYGVVRCGYDGKDVSGNKNYRTLYDERWTPATSVPRSNVYCLPSANVKDYTLEVWKQIIDNAIQNNRLINAYFHDVDFIETTDGYLGNRTILEGLIDYVKSSGITVIQLQDIPRIV